MSVEVKGAQIGGDTCDSVTIAGGNGGFNFAKALNADIFVPFVSERNVPISYTAGDRRIFVVFTSGLRIIGFRVR